jgi:hypothetical protein
VGSLVSVSCFHIGVFDRTVSPRKDKVVIYQMAALRRKGKGYLKQKYVNDQ